MAINRFSQPVQQAGYTPLSFQELAFAPVQMRQREDRMEAAKSEILNQANNMQFYDGYNEEAGKAREGIVQEFNQLSEDIVKNGAGLDAVNRLNNLRNKYNKMVSSSGTLGRAAGVKKTIDSKKQAYMQYAIENAKQAPEDAERNFQVELGKYKKGLPSKLDDFEGNMPEFNPTLAPDHQDMAAYMKKYYDLAGKIRDEYGDVSFQPQTDAKGNITGYHVFKGSTKLETNDPNIQQLTQLVKDEILNPNSELARDMAYKNLTPEFMMKKIDAMGEYMTTTITGEDTDYRTTLDNGGTGTKGRGKKSNVEEEEVGTVSLTPIDGNGSPVAPHTESIEAIDARVAELERDQSLDPAKKEQEITSLTHNKMKKLKERDKYMFAKDEAGKVIEGEFSDKYIADREQLVQNNERLQELGITSWAEYQAALQDPLYTEPQPDKIPIRNAMNKEIRREDGSYYTRDIIRQPKLAGVTEQLKMAHEEMLETQASNPMTANSEQYTFGFGNADNKLNDTLSKALPVQQILGMASQGLIDISNADPSDLVYEQLDPDIHQGFTQLLNAGELEFTYGAINSGSPTANPEIIFSAKAKDFKRDFSIELKDNGFTRELLAEDGALYTALDPKGRNIIANIRDNIEYAGLPTGEDLNINDNTNEMFSNDQSKTVLAFSKKANQGILNNVRNTDTKTQTPMEKMITESLFIKNDGHSYGVTVNRDNSYSSYRRNKDTGKIEPFTIGHYFDKKLAERHAKEYFNDAFDPTAINTPEMKQKMKRDVVDELVSFYQSINDINNISQEALFYGGNVPKFEKQMKDIHLIYNSKKTDADKYDEIYNIYKNMAGMRLQSKRRKEVL